MALHNPRQDALRRKNSLRRGGGQVRAGAVANPSATAGLARAGQAIAADLGSGAVSRRDDVQGDIVSASPSNAGEGIALVASALGQRARERKAKKKKPGASGLSKAGGLFQAGRVL
jgi:hypothetical protein